MGLTDYNSLIEVTPQAGSLVGISKISLPEFIKTLSSMVNGWPLLIYVIIISIIYTVALRGIQFRYLWTALKSTVAPSDTGVQQESNVSPFHAFISTINSNLGNGIIAGVATAIYAGGPGAALWFVIFGFILMAVRFAEVYLSTLYASKSTEKTVLGGPMLYLKAVPGGKYLPFIYAFSCVFYGLIGGNIAQANSIAVSLSSTWGVAPLYTGLALLGFVLYILFGGAQRIVKISVSIVPIKVIVFMLSSISVLLFHYKSLLSALYLIVTSGLGFNAVAGGAVGFSLQQMIVMGMARSVFCTESGLGSAAILFGSTGNDNAAQNGFMGMVSTFISTCIGFIVAVCIVASGVWNSGLNSTALTIAAFDTVFGAYGGWIVSFLAISFGFGVMVSYAYVVRSAWLYVTNNRFDNLFTIVYSLCAFGGSLAAVDVVWDLTDIVIAIMLFINLYGLLMLLPKIRTQVIDQLRTYRV
ncbi:MAG TPA: amino acid carrier protein [Candidatus Babeliales bacterium]|nr:amino acid carrier protein [Candidatus Babeliales bacterium]